MNFNCQKLILIWDQKRCPFPISRYRRRMKNSLAWDSKVVILTKAMLSSMILSNTESINPSPGHQCPRWRGITAVTSCTRVLGKAIRRISWLAPQKEDEEGCLFLMLGRCFFCSCFSQRIGRRPFCALSVYGLALTLRCTLLYD